MDYPRDYTGTNLDINIGTAFIIMPIKQELDMTLAIITEVCENLNIKAQRADDITKQDIIMSSILNGIAKSEIVIVDITGNNPNVFYELGIAHTLKHRQSVIIITQDKDIPRSTPFDLRHWSIISYSYNNLALFKVNLINKINESRKYIDFEEYINRLLKSHAFDIDLIQQFIKVSKQINITNLELSCSILSENISIQSCNRDKILELNTYLTTLGDYKNGEFNKITWLLKYLLFTSDFVLSQYIDTLKTIFFKEWDRKTVHLINMDYWEMVANISFKIIEKKHKDKFDAINWLAKYLRNYRMGRIDRVRTKIEDFMLTIQDKDVDKIIIEMLTGPSRTAKESAIDICGQKPIHESINIIMQFLINNESDPHIVRSCIIALSRMNVTIAAPIILKWMEENKDKWGIQAVSASLKSVAEKALQTLDENIFNQLSKLKEE